MAVVGYRIFPDDDDKSYLIVRNSWGKDWGDKGYGYLPLRFCEKLRCVAYAISDVSVIEKN